MNRIDRVAAILVSVYFDYYEKYADTGPRLSKEWKALCNEAHGIWEDGKVEIVDEESFTYQVLDFDNGIPTRFPVCLKPPHCTCRHFDQTGKICVHLKAASLLLEWGLADEWKGMSRVGSCVDLPHTDHRFFLTECESAAMRRRQKGSKKKRGTKVKRMVDDATIESEMRYIYDRMDGQEVPLPSPEDMSDSDSSTNSDETAEGEPVKESKSSQSVKKRPSLPGTSTPTFF